MDVAEGRGDHVAAALAEAELLGRRQAVLGGRVELGVVRGLDAVLLAADHADLDLEDDVRGGALVEELLGEVEVLVQLDRGAVPHVRLEERVATGRHALGAHVDERAHEAVELVLGAVVGVQRDRHVVLRRHHVGELGQRDRADDHVLDRLAGGELRAAPRDLHDAVALRLGEAPDRGVDRSDDEVQLMAG